MAVTTVAPSNLSPAAKPADKTARADGGVRRRIDKQRDALSDLVDTRLHEAKRTARKARFAAEDVVDVGAVLLRRHPFRTAAAAFAIGVVAAAAVRQVVARLTTACEASASRR